jgi:hypothetical protein
MSHVKYMWGLTFLREGDPVPLTTTESTFMQNVNLLVVNYLKFVTKN